jgi:RNA polymerase sigma-70 factor, ECF subfamily
MQSDKRQTFREHGRYWQREGRLQDSTSEPLMIGNSPDALEPQPSQGGEGSFVELFLRHERSLYAFIVQLVHDYADAEDLLQNTGLVLWKKFDQYQPGTDFLAWARQIAKYEVQTHLKTKRRTRICFSSATIDLLAGDLDRFRSEGDRRLDALRRCLDRLPRNDRDLVARCYSRQSTIQQIAQLIERPVDSVYQSLRRIRQALMHCIERRLTAEERA